MRERGTRSVQSTSQMTGYRDVDVQPHAVSEQIVTCERCPRLREYCARIGRDKRRAYRDDIYWARPVPGFGDPDARLLIVGLAPAAHGANRTGRVFTGDGVGGSGDFLMAALHRAGFANLPTSQSSTTAWSLRDAYIAAAVRCAPPDNKPTPEEIANCLPHLDAEVAALPSVRVVVALGKIAFDAYLQMLKHRGAVAAAAPAFRARREPHPARRADCSSAVTIRAGRTPTPASSRPRMMDDVFRLARRVIAGENQLDTKPRPDARRQKRA